MSKLIVVFLGYSLVNSLAFSQHSGYAKSDGSDEAGYSFDIPHTRPVVTERQASLEFPISGIDQDSQTLVNLAVEAIHGFWLAEAERYLREVTRRHPTHPMPVVLAALTQKIFGSGDYERGEDYFGQAVRLKKNYEGRLSSREDAWFHAIGELYSASDRDEDERAQLYIKALEDLVTAYPEDFEAKAFLGLAYWTDSISNLSEDDDEKRIELEQTADALIEEVLDEYPNHPAHHYKIHLWNNGKDEARALWSARRIGPAQSHIAHLWHMPAHIFTRTGDYYIAWRHVEIAHRVDNQQLYERRLMPSHQHNYYHNYRDFAVALKAGIGQLDGAIHRGLAMLSHGRALNKRSRIDHQLLVERLLTELEEYQAWEKIRELNERGYFADLDTQTDESADALFKAKVLRWRILAETGSPNGDDGLADELLEELWGIQNDADIEDEDKVTLTNLYKDAFLRREVTMREENHTVSAALINQLVELDISNRSQLLLIAWDQGLEATAIKIVKKLRRNLEERQTLPTLLNLLYYAQIGGSGVKGAMRGESLRKRIVNTLVPDETTIASLQTLRLAQDFPEDITALVDESRKAIEIRLEQMDPAFAYLKEFNHETMRFEDPAFFTLPEYNGPNSEADDFFATPERSRAKLFVFSQGTSCVRCNDQLAELISRIEDFESLNVDIHFIHPDEGHVEEITSLSDPDYAFFKAFGSWDQFTDAPLHGMYLVDANRQVLWQAISEHAVDDLDFVVAEVRRLLKLH